MNESFKIYYVLKRNLKRKLRITESLLIAFLITGGVSFAVPVIGDIKSDRDVIDENKFTEKNSTVIDGDSGVVIDASEISSKINGVIIKNSPSKIWNISKIENSGDYGMVAINGGTGINFGSRWWTDEIDNVRSSSSGEKGIFNKKSYGMVAVTDRGGEKSIISNHGLVENSGDYGMYSEANGIDTKVFSQNKGYSIDYYIAGYRLGDEGIDSIDKYSDIKDSDKFYEKIEKSLDGISNAGKYGMATLSLNGGISNQKNYGLIKNGDDYGIVAQSIGEGSISNIENVGGEEKIFYTAGVGNQNAEALFYENKNGIKNNGKYGMSILAQNGGEVKGINAINIQKSDSGCTIDSKDLVCQDPDKPFKLEPILGVGLVANAGDVGMIGTALENGESLLINEGVDISYVGKTTVEIGGGVKNKGNYGMVSLTDGSGKSKAINRGLVANTGDFGMYSEGVGSVIENRGRDLTGEELSNILAELLPKLQSENKDEKIWEEIEKISVSGGIKNEGNIGVYVGGNSTFINHGLINPEGITKTEEGKAVLKALGFSETDKVAIVGGEGHNTIMLGTGSQISGKVSGGLGDNTLYFIDTYDERTGKLIENNLYGEIIPKSFSHLIFGKHTVDIDENGKLIFNEDKSLSESVWKIKDEIVLDYHENTNKTDYTAVMKDGKLTITSDKFNGIHINGVFLDRDGEDREKIDELLKGNIVFENGSSLVKHVGKNVTSTLAANSINMNGGTITQRVLDNLFVTNADRIEITNIFTSALTEQQKREIEEKGLLINGEQVSGNIKLPEEYFKVESIAKEGIVGWDSWHEYDPLTGEVVLVFERVPVNPIAPTIPDGGNSGLQGGYAQSIERYTQSNVDIINTMYIRNEGSNYIRKIAFMPMVPTIEIVEVENEERHNNIQMAEVFGDYGKYTGSSSSEFSYDTWGITGGTFHRFNDEWLTGITYGYAQSKVDYKTGEGGTEDVDTIGVNLHLAYEKNNWLSINSIGYSWNKHDLNRRIYDRDSEVLGKSPVQTMTADFYSHLISVGTELGYRYILDESSYLYPYVGLDYIWYTREGYKENGDVYALDIDETKLDTFVSKVGLMYEKSWNRIGTFIDFGWQHYFDDFKSFDGKFYNESSALYRIEGLDIGKDVGYFRIGAEYNFKNDITTGIDYTGTFRRDEMSNRIGLNIQYKW